MAPLSDDDWSDSDEGVDSEVETSVLLGIPDGPITSIADTSDAAVSRIGGHPAFLPSNEPPFTSSLCKICKKPMELLVQMWCPFENSPMDRALYIWGCSRTGCQRNEGSVRAWRGLRYNSKYAAKLEKLAQARGREKARADAEAKKNTSTSKANPFSMKAPMTNPFGLGTQIFGAPLPSTPELSTPDDEVGEDQDKSDTESHSSSSSSSESLLTAMASSTMAESPWTSAPSYPSLYLSTISEYLPPLPTTKSVHETQILDAADGEGKAGKDASWAFETYENSLVVDHVFDRFTKRVGFEPQQCVRYELRGAPLPFSSGKTFDMLFPVPDSPPLPVTKPDFKVVSTQHRSYNPTNITPCPFCKSTRVFECQIMPNLINVLKTSNTEKEKNTTDEERRKSVEKALNRADADEIRDMEWGTCMVFSCERDCCVDDDGNEARECWKEEFVLVEWDV